MVQAGEEENENLFINNTKLYIVNLEEGRWMDV